MKYLFLLICFLGVCNHLYPQIYALEVKARSTTDNAFGINTTPASGFAMDLNGNLFVGNTTSGEGLISFRRGSDNALNGYIGFSGNNLFLRNTYGQGIIKLETNIISSGVKEVMRIDWRESGYVGIGNPAPCQKLHIKGNICMESNKILLRGLYSRMNEIYSLGGSSGTEGSWYSISYYDNIMLNAGDSRNGSRKIVIRTGTIGRMTVQGNGRASIGTTSHQQKLHVNRQIHASKVSFASDEKFQQNITGYEPGLAMVKQI